jgi:hypothetical protein
MRPGLTRTEVTERKGEIRQFFAEYYAAFDEAVRDDAPDIGKLIDFFTVPLTIITGETHVCLATPDAMGAALKINIDRLRALRFERSVPERSDFRLLNDKACLLEVEWARKGLTGAVESTLRLLYLIADTSLGWRIVTMVVMGEPPNETLLNPEDHSGQAASSGERPRAMGS